MKSKFNKFPGISIDHVLIALLVALLLSMVARAHSHAELESETGLHVFDSYAKSAL
jgi:hypothetical protein